MGSEERAIADVRVTPPRAARSTQRLTVEPTTRAMAERIWKAAEASMPELRPWMAWAATSTVEETEGFADRSETEWAAGTGFRFTLLEEGEVVGGVGLEVRGPLERLGEIGYWVRSDRCGRGYATEAAASIVDFAFEELRLNRLELRAGVSSRASQRVAEKLGFQREGRLREASRGADSTYDSYIYGLLASDPRQPARARR